MKKYLLFILPLLWAACTHQIKPAESPSRQPITYDTTINGRVYIGPGWMASPDQAIRIDPSFATAPTVLKYHISGDIVLTPYGVVPPADTIVTPPVDTVVVPPVVVIGDAEKVGLKVFPWTGLARVKALGINQVSCYCPAHWITTKNGLFCQPFYQAYTNEAPGLDGYLAQAKSLGMRVHLVVNQTPEWLRPTGNGNGGNDFPPIPAGLDRNDPKSYALIADVFKQLAMRYGKVKYPESALRIDQTPQYPNQPVTPKVSGLDMPVSLAFGNEVDRWYNGFDSPEYMKPSEMAAYLVACSKAVRSADPYMEYWMPGLTDFQFDYLKEVYRVFCIIWPEGKAYFPNVDLHHYGNILNRPGTDKPTWAMDGGCYPEDDAAFSQINQIVAWSHGIGKKCIISEFGYDKKGPSMMHIVGKGISDEQAQGVGIVKTYQAYLAAGVDGAYCYEAADEGVGSGLFTTCGLFGTQANGFPPFESAKMVKATLSAIRVKGAFYALYDTKSARPAMFSTGQTIKIGDMKDRAHKFHLPKNK